jgi:hypothetical protein
MMRVWAYVNEKGVLCCAVLPEAVPQGVQAIELEVDSPEDVTLENGEIRIKSDAEKLQDAKLRLLEELKTMIASLLAPTDYVTIKIAEAVIVGQETDQLKQYYASALAKRQQIRQFNADMKQAIARAKTLEELKQLRETIFQATNSLR